MMITLTDDDISLNCRAANRTEALQLAGNTLIGRGLASHGFSEALLARETALSTWLDHGVAMPHIDKKNAGLIIHTGFHFLQFPEGVKWERGKIAFLVIVVAAKANEHIDVLAGIADMLSDEMQIALLSQAKTTEEFQSVLRGPN